MFQTGYNIPEGYGYDDNDFLIDSSKTYEERYQEVYDSFLNDEVICAKVTKVVSTGKVLCLDFGAGVKGICNKNFVADNESFWINQYLTGKYVNVKISSLDSKRDIFICSRDILQIKAFEIQKEEYKYGTKIKGKILGNNRKIVVIDVGAGNLVVTPINTLKSYKLTNDNHDIDLVIGKYNYRFNNFKISFDDGNGKQIHVAKIITMVEEGYLVNLIDKPDKYMIMKTSKELNVGDVVIANVVKNKFANIAILTYISMYTEK